MTVNFLDKVKDMKKSVYLRKKVYSIVNLFSPIISGSRAENLVYEGIMKGTPFMVARLGAVESKAMIYASLPQVFKFLLKKYILENMHRNAGFFPVTEENLHHFYQIMCEAMESTDILGSWRPEEIFFHKSLKNSQKIALGIIGPHETNYSWTRALAGKKILVVHPFAESIEKQYRERRELLHENPDTLPKFSSLETIKAVQTIAGNTAGFNNWFEALDFMKSEIDKHDFDICILGCGAYGYPLAAYVKKKGKVSLHLGGPVQLYFGIKGKRWDNSGLYNDYWISPSEEERPENLENVENGCYW